jgi:hypothetical protein
MASDLYHLLHCLHDTAWCGEHNADTAWNMTIRLSLSYDRFNRVNVRPKHGGMNRPRIRKDGALEMVRYQRAIVAQGPHNVVVETGHDALSSELGNPTVDDG